MEENLQNNEVPELKDHFSLAREIWEWVYTIGIALIIVFVLKSFVFDIVRVDGPSMNPTLVNNDRLIITKLGYEPKMGDIIILDSNYKEREDYYRLYTAENSAKKLNPIRKGLLYLSDMPKNLRNVFYVKRIVALPGDTVDIKDGKVYINGELLDEPYYDGITTKTDYTVNYPVTVEDNHVFVMGDNRPNSKDSRSSSLGLVPFEAIEGKAQFRMWPISDIGTIE